MKKISLDLVKLKIALQGNYRVVATYGDKYVDFETRNEDVAHEVYNLAEKILTMDAQIIEGFSIKSGEPYFMIDFDDGETRVLSFGVEDRDFAANFLSQIIEWTQEE